jgi:hypothetical protein
MYSMLLCIVFMCVHCQGSLIFVQWVNVFRYVGTRFVDYYLNCTETYGNSPWKTHFCFTGA